MPPCRRAWPVCRTPRPPAASPVAFSASLLGFRNGTLERRYSRIMLSPPLNMKPNLGHCGSIMRAYSLLRVLLCFLRPTLVGLFAAAWLCFSRDLMFGLLDSASLP